MAAAVILPPHSLTTPQFGGVKDSKALSPRQRARLAPEIRQFALAWGVGAVPACEIDEMGIVAATQLAMLRAVEELRPPPEFLLLDALSLPQAKFPQMSIVKGDALCLSIAAASILAKVARDALMEDYDCTFPGYGFRQHKGYGTAAHQEALCRLGPSSIHRLSYSPMRLGLRG